MFPWMLHTFLTLSSQRGTLGLGRAMDKEEEVLGKY